jgi:hypothetical protein
MHSVSPLGIFARILLLGIVRKVVIDAARGAFPSIVVLERHQSTARTLGQHPDNPRFPHLGFSVVPQHRTNRIAIDFGLRGYSRRAGFVVEPKELICIPAATPSIAKLNTVLPAFQSIKAHITCTV